MSAGAAGVARVVVTAAPHGPDRAKNLPWAAGRLAGRAIGLGLEPVPQVLLHPPVTGRFTTCAPGLSGSARRALRTNLRFLARTVVPQLCPADAPLPRERAKAPCAPGEIDGYLTGSRCRCTASRGGGRRRSRARKPPAVLAGRARRACRHRRRPA